MSEITTQMQVRFSVDTASGRFTDALYLAVDEYEKMGEKGVQSLIDERVANWLAIVTAPPVEVEPESDEVVAKRQNDLVNSLLDQLEQCDTTLVSDETAARVSEVSDQLAAAVDESRTELQTPKPGEVGSLDEVLKIEG